MLRSGCLVAVRTLLHMRQDYHGLWTQHLYRHHYKSGAILPLFNDGKLRVPLKLGPSESTRAQPCPFSVSCVEGKILFWVLVTLSRDEKSRGLARSLILKSFLPRLVEIKQKVDPLV